FSDLDTDADDSTRHGGSHVLGVAWIRLGMNDDVLCRALVLDLDRPRLAIELEEHAALAPQVGFARRQHADDQGLAALDVDTDLFEGFHAIEEHRRRQRTDIAVLAMM